MFNCLGTSGGKKKHVEGEYTSNQSGEVCADQGEKDTDKGSGEGRRVPRSRPKTLVSSSRLGLKGRSGSRWVTYFSFEYDVSSSDEVIDLTTVSEGRE